MGDVFAAFWSDALFDQNSKLIKNLPFNVYTDVGMTIEATIYTDRTKGSTVNQSTLLTDNTGVATIYVNPGTYYVSVPSATLARQIYVREDIADTADENAVLLIASNLSDLNNIATARGNLGLGSAATQAASGFDNAGAAASAYGLAQAYANAQVAASGGVILNLSEAYTNSTVTTSGGVILNLAEAYTNSVFAASGGGGGSGGALLILNNLGDLNNIATARTNLGLGSAATQAASGFDNAGAAASAQAAATAASQGSWNVRNVTAAATGALWDYIWADTTSASGGFAVTAPSPVANKQFGMKWKAGAVAPTLNGSFEDTPTFSMLHMALEFISDGSSWAKSGAYYPLTKLARLDADNDFGAHVLKNYRDDENTYSSATAILGTDLPWGSSRQLTNASGCAVTLPNDTTLGLGSWALLTQSGTNQDTFIAASGASIHEPDGLSSTAKQYASLLVRVTSNNGTNVVYTISGYTGSAPLLLDTTNVPTALAAYGLRKLRAAYAGNAIQVTRASDSTTQDIGFTVAGMLDTGSLATFCSGTTGYVSKWYDQTGNGHDLVQATQANMWRIYASSAVDSAGTLSLPALFSVDGSRGMACTAFAAYTGTVLSAAAIALLKSTATASLSPRYLSVWGASNTDNADNSGLEMFARNGGSTPAQAWLTRHNALSLAASGGAVYNQLQQLMTQVDNGAATLDTWVDGVNSHGTGSTGAFNTTTIGIGETGNATQSVTGACISEAIIFESAINSAAQTAIRSNQKAYYGTT